MTAGRRAPARRRTAARRRWRLLAAVLVIAVCVAVVAAMPLFKKAISELTLPLNYASIIRTEAAANHLPPTLVAAVIYAETRYDPRTSPTGAEGLMQIEPQTAEFLAKRSGGYAFKVSDLGEPQVNIAYGTYYLRYLLNEYDDSPIAALAAYNGGETNVDHWLTRAGVRPAAFTTAEIPFPQTRAYVDKVLQAQKDYRKTYAVELGYRS